MFTSWVDPPLRIGITLTSFNRSGYTPDCRDILIIDARGVIIRSGINDNNFNGMLEGPVDLFSNEYIMSRISSLDICAITKFIWLRFFKKKEGEIGTFRNSLVEIELNLELIVIKTNLVSKGSAIYAL